MPWDRCRPWVLLLTLTLLLVACDDADGTDATAATQEPDAAAEQREVDVFSLEVGTCFDAPEDSSQVVSVASVDCAQPHDYEVYAVFDLADGPFPSPEELAEQSETGCLDRFESYVDHPYATSEIYAQDLRPTEESWENGDREVLCLLHIPGEQMVGSMRGAAR